MKVFNFETSKHSPEKTQWLRENHNKKITVEEFLVEWIKLKHTTTRGRRNGLPSHAKSVYKQLVKNFGFFK